MLKINDNDRKCVVQVKTACEIEARGIRERNPEAIPSKFVSVALLVKRYAMDRVRIERCIKLGMLEARGSDGFGVSVCPA